VIAALTSAKGRGKSGLSEDQLAQLNEAIEALEADSGVSGEQIAAGTSGGKGQDACLTCR
jgi:hypothetical protein